MTDIECEEIMTDPKTESNSPQATFLLEQLGQAQAERLGQFFETATQLLVESRSGPLAWPISPDGQTRYTMLVTCQCSDLRIFAQPFGSGRRAWSICAEHGLQSIGILVRALPARDHRTAEGRRHSGMTALRWHRSRERRGA